MCGAPTWPAYSARGRAAAQPQGPEVPTVHEAVRPWTCPYLRPSLTVLDLYTNGIASVPTEIAPLTGLQDLSLALNLNGLTGFPMWTPHHVPDLRPVALLRLVQERRLIRERGRLQLRQSRGWHLRLHL